VPSSTAASQGGGRSGSKGPALYALGAAIGTVLLQNDLKVLRSIGYTIELLLFLRFAGSLLLSILCMARFTPKPKGSWLGFKPRSMKEQWRRGGLMLGTTLGVFCATVYLMLVQLSLLSLAMWPQIALLIAPRFGEKIFKLGFVIASSILTLLGLGILLISAGVDDLPRFAAGAGWVAVASVCTALNQHYNRRANQRGEDPYVSMFYQALPGFLVTSMLWFVPGVIFERIEFSPAMVAIDHVFWLVLVPVLGFLPQFFYLKATKAPVSRTTPIAASQPIFGGGLDYWRDGTIPAPLDWVGLGVVAAGIVTAWPALFAKAKGHRPGPDDPQASTP
jgi:drug/metabolite transporter (DMT)-like permease